MLALTYVESFKCISDYTNFTGVYNSCEYFLRDLWACLYAKLPEYRHPQSMVAVKHATVPLNLNFTNTCEQKANAHNIDSNAPE